MDKKLRSKLDVIEKFLAFINRDFCEENYQFLAFSYASSIYKRPLKKWAKEFAKDWMVGMGCKTFQYFLDLINQAKEILNQLKVPSQIRHPNKRPNPPGTAIDIINFEAGKIPHSVQKAYGDYSMLEFRASPQMFKDYLIYPLILMVEGKSNEWLWLRSCKKCGKFLLDLTKNHSKQFCQDTCKVYQHRQNKKRENVTAKA